MTTPGWPPQPQPSWNPAPPAPPTRPHGVWMAPTPPEPPKRPWWKRKRVLVPAMVGFGLISLLVVAPSASTPTVTVTETTTATAAPAAKPQAPAKSAKNTATPVKMTALIAEFDRNQVAAEKKWKGRPIQVSGKISNISTDILGTTFIAFQNPTDPLSLTTVSCYLDDAEQAVSLGKGETHTVVGRVDGQSLGTIMIKDCRLVK